MHKCNAVTAWFRDHQEFTVIEWPSRSPDLNPIENLWGIMVNEWPDRNERMPDVLERHYMEVWESIRRDPELCQHLVQVLAGAGVLPEGGFGRRGFWSEGVFCPDGFFPVPIDNNGGYTKY